jgi:hypothetical protein
MVCGRDQLRILRNGTHLEWLLWVRSRWWRPNVHQRYLFLPPASTKNQLVGHCPHFVALFRPFGHGCYHCRWPSYWINMALGIWSCCNLRWHRTNSHADFSRRNILSATSACESAAGTQISNDAPIMKLPVLLSCIYYFFTFAFVIGNNVTISVFLVPEYNFNFRNLAAIYVAPVIGPSP